MTLLTPPSASLASGPNPPAYQKPAPPGPVFAAPRRLTAVWGFGIIKAEKELRCAAVVSPVLLEKEVTVHFAEGDGYFFFAIRQSPTMVAIKFAKLNKSPYVTNIPSITPLYSSGGAQEGRPRNKIGGDKTACIAQRSPRLFRRGLILPYPAEFDKRSTLFGSLDSGLGLWYNQSRKGAPLRGGCLPSS